MRFTFATPHRPFRVCVRKSQSDLLIVWQIFLRRFYEPDTAYHLDQNIDTLDTIVDLGGNTGLAAAYLDARYRPRTLLTVEPIAESRAVLEHDAAEATPEATGATAPPMVDNAPTVLAEPLDGLRIRRRGPDQVRGDRTYSGHGTPATWWAEP
ncbi:hypothetical protein [Streptomyces sp. NPDC047061]|uniref:hypothetical protein n=1 Tax=Streptomyces sp. NPDC047061 TaxID=3154605 RepID=UPI0033C10024